VFSDADMAGDIDRQRSTSGVLIFLGSALISWLSLKQKVVALMGQGVVPDLLVSVDKLDLGWIRRWLSDYNDHKVVAP